MKSDATFYQNDAKYYQNILREAECFIHIVNLLSHLIMGRDTDSKGRRGRSYIAYQRRRLKQQYRRTFAKEPPPTPQRPRMPKDARQSPDLSATLATRAAREVLLTLSSLMRENSKNRSNFATAVGYTHLQTILIQVVQCGRCNELYESLFDFLALGRFCPIHAVTFRNPDVLPLIFGLLPARPVAQQALFLDFFIQITSKSVLNQEFCCRSRIVDTLLDMLPYTSNRKLMFRSVAGPRIWAKCRCTRGHVGLNPDTSAVPACRRASLITKSEFSLQTKIIDFIQILGAHSLTVPQLKKLFRIMKSNETLTPKLRDPVRDSAGADGSGVRAKLTFTPADASPPNSPLSKSPSLSKSSELAPGGDGLGSTTASNASLLASPSTPRGVARDLHVVSTRPTYNPLMLAAIERMYIKTGPENYWYLEGGGRGSGLRLPRLVKFPPRGFAISMWLRVAAQGASQTSTLFYLRGKNGARVEMCLADMHLVMKIRFSDGKCIELPNQSMRTRRGQLEPRMWYHVVMTHNNRYLKSQVQFTVNGVCMPSHRFYDVRYPNITGPLQDILVGTDAKGSDFCGQIGSFYMFGDALSDEEAKIVWDLGPSYLFSFQNLSSSVLAKKVVLAYNAKARTQDSGFSNNATTDIHGVTPSGPNGDLTARVVGTGTYACATRHIRDVMHCLGGIQVLFPISEQLDQPVRVSRRAVTVLDDGSKPGRGAFASSGKECGDASSSSDTDENSSDAEFRYLRVVHEVNYDPDPDFVCRILRLMRIMILRDPTNRVFMQRHRGFALLAFILEKLSPSNIDRKVALEIDHLSRAVASHAEMKYSAFWNLVANTQLWVYAPESTRQTWSKLLTGHVSTFITDPNPNAVQRILDCLRRTLWYEPEPDSLCVSETFQHPITGDVIGRRVPVRGTMLQKFRGIFLDFIAQRVVRGAFSVADVRAVLMALEHTRDGAQQAEILNIFTHFLDKRPADLIRHLGILEKEWSALAVGKRKSSAPLRYCIDALLSGAGADSPKTRAGCLHAIAKLIFSGASVDVERVARVARDKLYRYSLDVETYSAILSLMLRQDLRVESDHIVYVTRKLDERHVIHEPSCLCLIFDLMTNSSPRTNQIILQQVVVLLNSDVNKDIVLKQPNWQSWLLRLADYTYATLEREIGKERKNKEIQGERKIKQLGDESAGGQAEASAAGAAASETVSSETAASETVTAETAASETVTPVTSVTAASETADSNRASSPMSRRPKRNRSFASCSVVATYTVHILQTMLFHALRTESRGWTHWRDAAAWILAHPIPNYDHEVLEAAKSFLTGVIPTLFRLSEHTMRLLEREGELLLSGVDPAEMARASSADARRFREKRSKLAMLWNNVTNVVRLTHRALAYELVQILGPGTSSGRARAADAAPASRQVQIELTSLWPCVDTVSRMDAWLHNHDFNFSADSSSATGQAVVGGGSTDAESAEAKEIQARATRTPLGGAIGIIFDVILVAKSDYRALSLLFASSASTRLHQTLSFLCKASTGTENKSKSGAKAGSGQEETPSLPRLDPEPSAKLTGIVRTLLKLINTLVSADNASAGMATDTGSNSGLKPIDFALKSLACVLKCNSRWPLGLLKGIEQLDSAPPASDSKRLLRWRNESVATVLQNSTWVRFVRRVGSISDGDPTELPITMGMPTAEKIMRDPEWAAPPVIPLGDTAVKKSALAGLEARHDEEKQRRDHWSARSIVSKRIRLRTLEHILHNLSNERGPWCPYCETDVEHEGTRGARRTRGDRKASYGSGLGGVASVSRRRGRSRRFKIVKRPKIFWKLDKSETPGRARIKLKVNHSGTDHAGCKIKSQRQPKGRTSSPTDGQDYEMEDEDAIITKAIKVSLPLLKDEDKQKNSQKRRRQALDDLVLEDEKLLQAGDTKTSTQSDGAVPSLDLTFRTSCVMMTPAYATPGHLVITKKHMLFEVDEQKASQQRGADNGWTRSKHRREWERNLPQGYDRKWDITTIRALLFRRKKLQSTALEVFFEDNTNCFFDFETVKVRNRVYREVCTMLPDPDAERADGCGFSDIKESIFSFLYKKPVSLIAQPEKIMERAGLTKLWVERKITNFDYLMMLNTIAGRTYNDLSQYPVMPWVIADYTSPTLDLKDEKSFRDLRKPIGALNETRLQKFKNRMAEWDASIPRFLYGTHYSSAGYVLFYMIRAEPFTTEAIRFQSGHFDHPDRMFHSVAMAWEGCQTGFADVKELIPEWYYQPEIFRNINNYDMGERQTGEKLGDVVLPPWASSPEEFVRLNREALESEYVSQNLHHWIDLIFGDKQQGEKAVEADNLFCHYTYENRIDINSIEDEVQKMSVLAQIEQFGQCPTQLFTKPHPKRSDRGLIDISVFSRLGSLKAYTKEQVTGGGPLVYIANRGEAVTTVAADRSVNSHVLRDATSKFIPPFMFRAERSSRARRIGVEFVRNLGGQIDQRFFSLTSDGRCLFTCGHWDNSFKASWVDTGNVIQSIALHKGAVTCLAMSSNNRVVVTGSNDTTVMVWNRDPHKHHVHEDPRHILYGHDDAVTCVDVSVEYDVVISCSNDGSVIIHTLRSGDYVRSIYPPSRSAPIRWVGLSAHGMIFTYSAVSFMLHSFSINGRPLQSTDTKSQLTSFKFSPDGKYLLTGGRRGGKTGVLVARVCHSLKIKCRKETRSPIRCLTTTMFGHQIIVGLADGRLVIYALNESVMRAMTVLKLHLLGF